jgi:hypothetical protein
MNVTTVIPMLTMVRNEIWRAIHSVTLPEPAALILMFILMAVLMLTVGNLQRRATLRAQALCGSSNL